MQTWREHLATIRPDADPAEADWWDTEWPESLKTPPAVGFLIPHGFEAYARVLHPARLDDEPRTRVRWAEVAVATGTTLHPQAQWWRLARRGSSYDQGGSPGSGWPGSNPCQGILVRPDQQALAAVLASHTSTPGRTLVAYWVGHGVWPRSWDTAPQARVVRGEHLFQRPLADVDRLCAEAPAVRWAIESGGQSVTTFGGDGTRPTDDDLLVSFGANAWQSPTAWWPADIAWATSNDTDLDSTLVGGTRALVDDLLADDRVEALPWPVDGSLWADADAVNV